MQKYKIGIIGYGGMGSWHAENISKRIPSLDVAGVYDIKQERLDEAEKCGFTTYDTAEKLLDSDIDLVLVAVPNNFHKSYSIEAMRKGKHVVCEKPVCLNSTELEEIFAVAAETGRLFTVHHNRRWDIDFHIVKTILEKKIVGSPYFIDSRLFGCKGLPGDWRSAKISGGGMLYDWSIHLIDQILMLVDSEPLSVYCEALKVNFTDVDDCNRILITFKNGVRAQIVVDTWCYIGENRWHISGNDGTAVIHDWLDIKGRIIKANIKEIDWEEGIIFTPTGRTKTMAPRPKESLQEIALPIPSDENAPRWEEFYENVIESIKSRTEPIVTKDQLRKSMKVLEACFKSAELNETVKV